MNVPTMTMPIDEAKAAFRQYREAVRENPNSIDQAIMIGYRALAKGKMIVDLFEAILAGGVNDLGLPMLAAARANWKWVELTRRFRGPFDFEFRKWPEDRAGRRAVIEIPNGTFPVVPQQRRAPRAMVPLIPPQIRPAEGQLGEYTLLWEADWQFAPTDPMLLKHLSGSLYAVLAVWDLTPLERSVLGAARLAERRLASQSRTLSPGGPSLAPTLSPSTT